MPFLLQTLNTISAEKNSTIVFPLPIDILTYFMNAKNAKSAANAANTPGDHN